MGAAVNRVQVNVTQGKSHTRLPPLSFHLEMEPGNNAILLGQPYATQHYRIAPTYRGTKFLRIGIAKHFAEIIFMKQAFQLATPIHGSHAY